MDNSFKWIGMEPDGNSVVLHRFRGNFVIKESYTEAWQEENKDFLSKAAVLDVETNGLSHEASSIIELGIRFFLYDKRNGNLVRVEDTYQSFEDPEKPSGGKYHSPNRHY